MKELSRIATEVRASTTMAIDAMFKQMKADGIDVIGFGAGEPDFNTPDEIKAAGIAAIEKYGAPVIVLDFGTATTLDAVSREGVYLGGCITAGVRVSIDGLFQKTALLPRVELVKPDTVLGLTAVGQIQAGAVLGYIGAIEYLIRKAREEMGDPEVKVVATGGLSRMVAENTDLIDVIDPQLVLDGLRIIYERARGTENQ